MTSPSTKVSFLCIGDPHFKVNNITRMTLMCENILKVITLRKPSFVVVMGDTLHTHESIHTAPLKLATKFLEDISKIVELYLLIGNHDLINNSQFLSDQHAFNALKQWKNTTVVDKTIVRNGFMFVPYVPPGKFKAALGNFDLKEVKCIFAHQEFKGAKMGAIQSTVGDEWDLKLPHIVSGHIHEYDQLQSNITYVGTPIQHTFGDGPKKTISLFTIGGDAGVSPSVNVSVSLREERISLGIPRMIKVDLTLSEIEKFQVDKEDETKIVITGTETEVKLAMKHQKVKMWTSIGVKIVYKQLSSTPNVSVNYTKEGFRSALIKRCQGNVVLYNLLMEINNS